MTCSALRTGLSTAFGDLAPRDPRLAFRPGKQLSGGPRRGVPQPGPQGRGGGPGSVCCPVRAFLWPMGQVTQPLHASASSSSNWAGCKHPLVGQGGAHLQAQAQRVEVLIEPPQTLAFLPLHFPASDFCCKINKATNSFCPAELSSDRLPNLLPKHRYQLQCAHEGLVGLGAGPLHPSLRGGRKNRAYGQNRAMSVPSAVREQTERDPSEHKRGQAAPCWSPPGPPPPTW